MRNPLAVLVLLVAVLSTALASQAGAVVVPEISCSFVYSRDSNAMSIRLAVPDAPDGTKIAINFERGERPNEDFVFIGRTNRTAALTNYILRPVPVEVREGSWDLKARVITPDGEKGDRVSCGVFNEADVLPPALVCFNAETFGGSNIVTEFAIANEVDGTRVAFNLRSTDGQRTYVYLGTRNRFPDDDRIQAVFSDIPTGEWELEARWRNADGTRGDRTSCGTGLVAD